jgi:hypothetical protein
MSRNAFSSTSIERLTLTVGPLQFTARVESAAAPKSVAVLAELLPLTGSLLHARWSGEAGWLPLGRELRLEPENATTTPQPGCVLLYGGTRSEPELLIPYGDCAFASRAGALAGNQVLTLEDEPARLRELGRLLLWEGAQPLELGRHA